MGDNTTRISFVEEGTNSPESSTVYPYYFPPSTHIVVGSYLIVVGILGTAGNAIVLTMFLRFRSLINPTALLLINLAVSDLGLIMLGFPFSSSSSYAGRWLYGSVGCQLYAFMGFLFGSAHIGTLALLALDRYLITCKISLRGKLTYRRYCHMLTSVWAYALFWASMPLLGWGRYGPEPSVTTCTIDWQRTDTGYKSFILVYFVLGFLVPFIIIAVCYTATARHMKKKSEHVSARNAIYDQWANERSITLMSFILIIAFLVAWTPYAVLCLWTIFAEPLTVPPTMTLLPPLFAKASTVINPIIYFMTNPRLRAGIIAVLTCCCRSAPPEIIEMPDSPERAPATSEVM